VAGIAHFGFGLASKRFASNIQVIILVFCAYLIDVLFFIFMLAGLEQFPQPGNATTGKWSHSLFMAIIWSLLAFIFIYLILKELHVSIFIGFLVFSHWVIDFISQPMTYVFPDSSGPLLHPFGDSSSVGLGLMSTEIGVIICEGGFLVIGLIIYLTTLIQLKKEKEILVQNY
jgi:hypothetical protein